MLLLSMWTINSGNMKNEQNILRYSMIWLMAVVCLLYTQPCFAGAPVFTNLPAVSIPLREDIRVQTSFYEVTASDPDGDRLQYNIVGPQGAPFVIDPISGIVSVRANPGLDFESLKQYQLQISVNDSIQSITSTLDVHIEDVDEAPVFVTLPASFSLPEDYNKVVALWNVTATDPEHEYVTYTLVSPLGAPFDVSPRGILSIRADPNFNFETRRQFTLTIAATDGTLSTLSTFTVNITDVNEPPQILNMGDEITVPKDTAGSIFKVNAIDEDNDKLTYSFVTYPNTTDANLFSINRNTGELIVHNPPGLNPNEENLYEVHITVTDSAGHNTTGILYVKVVSYMGFPEIWNLPNKKVLFENRTESAMIFAPRTIDLTQGGKLSYHMKAYPPDGKFTIDPNTGYVWVRENPGFDYEKNYKYDLEITVSNGVASSTPHQLHVRIVDMNEKPYITDVQTVFTVQENTPTPEVIHKVSAKDPERQTITFNLKVEPPEGQDKFAINPLNGEVSVSPVPGLDYEDLDQYTLTVTAYDGVLTSNPYRMTVDVTNVNEPPVYSSTYRRINIPEEMLVGDALPLSCAALDPDIWDKVLLYQLGRTTHSQYFSVDTTNGCQLKITKTFDSETTGSPKTVLLEVTAIDSRGLISKPPLHLDINIHNINDNSPEFSPTNYEVNLVEDTAVGSYLVRVTAHDKDVGDYGKLTYRISTSPGAYYFRVSTSGDVSVRAKLDRETIQKLTFKVVASDQGSPARSDTATVTVYVQDSNDHRPTFLKKIYDFEARYDTQVGTSVGRLMATDSDEGNTRLRYKLLGISDEFELNPNSGEIRTASSLAVKTRYLLQAVVEDNGSPAQTSKAVHIRVDTYTCKESLVVMKVNQAMSFFDDVGKSRFVRALKDEVFSGFVAKIERVRVGEKAGTSEVLVYFLRSNRTEDLTSLSEDKFFVPVTEILHSTNTGQDGQPNLRFMTGSFVSFPVTDIAHECEIEKVNWWLDTDGGRVTLGILATIGGVLALAALSYLAMLAVSRCNIFENWRQSRVSPRTTTGIKHTKLPPYKDDQNWWKLKPKAAFESSSALEEKNTKVLQSVPFLLVVLT
ncbi:protocadherin Fat 4-like isoform X2 [Liolophura sinensis]|uniref:protocadherin Fat 4-like isoform X2 n=1 Tax=Liolophura sinensis TaxID=3198878 RepID=UPI0031593D84